MYVKLHTVCKITHCAQNYTLCVRLLTQNSSHLENFTLQPKKLFPAPFEFFLPLFPSPSHHRAVEHTLTHEVIVHARVSLLCQGLSIKAWVNDRLKYKWKFLEIFQTDIASVDPSSWIAKISVEVENCVHHQSSKAS